MVRIGLELMAHKACDAMSEQRRIEFATDIILGVDAPNLVHRLEHAANQIGRHAHDVARDAMPMRSDGSIIHPYAPDGGPLTSARGEIL